MATVGGSLSQNAILWGCAKYGASAESVLRLEVVLADGSLLTTGSAGSLATKPFFRPFRRARAAGVRIAFGTDTGVANPHGSNGWEFARLVAAGLTPMEAVASATTVAAEMFGLEKDAGAVAPGFLSDLIALKSDPLADVAALRNPDFVMKAGRAAKRDGQMVPAEEWTAGSRHP